MQFEVLEIFPDGRRGRISTHTLRDLVSLMHDLNVDIESNATVILSEKIKR
jgi:hypothetical protein